MSEIIEVEVAGRSYRLRSDEGGSDLRAVAQLVNDRVVAIQRAAPDLEPERVAILAALNVGDELLRLRAAREAEAGDIERAVEAVRERLVALAERVEPADAPQD